MGPLAQGYIATFGLTPICMDGLLAGPIPPVLVHVQCEIEAFNGSDLPTRCRALPWQVWLMVPNYLFW